ncbi:MAG: glycosyltransferase family 39 protein [Phycisphaeraceae bacterium]|nr:glycosyltransferase family 39 protein [Phycisphaeraceae bacterium]
MTLDGQMNPSAIAGGRTISNKMFIFGLIAITLLGAGMRLWRLDSWSFWADELYSIRSVAGMDERWGIKTLGYLPIYVALKLDGVDVSKIHANMQEHWLSKDWKGLGVEEFNTRIGPCLVGIFTIPILCWISRRWIGDRAALLAALLLAVANWHIFWSQSARFYGQQFLFFNLALVWYYRATTEQSPWRMLAANACAVLGMLSQPPAIVILAVFFFDWIISRLRGEKVKIGPMGWGIAIFFVVAATGIASWDMSRSWPRWKAFFGTVYEGHTPWVMVQGMIYSMHPTLIAVAGLCALSLWPKRPRLTIYLVLAAVLPLIVMIAAYPLSYVHTRYLFISLYAWIVLAALGLERIYDLVKERWGLSLALAPAAGLIVTLLLFDHTYYTGGYGLRERWRDAWHYVQKHRQPGDAVAAKLDVLPYYYMQTDQLVSLPKSPEEIDQWQQPTWLVFHAESATRGQQEEWIEHKTELKAYYDVRIVQPFSSIRVYYYQPPAPPAAEKKKK